LLTIEDKIFLGKTCTASPKALILQPKSSNEQEHTHRYEDFFAMQGFSQRIFPVPHAKVNVVKTVV